MVGDWFETRPLRLPGVLVGDGRLGGISTTISAYESLVLRGYDVPVVIFEDNGLSNEVALLSYLKKRYKIKLSNCLFHQGTDITRMYIKLSI